MRSLLLLLLALILYNDALSQNIEGARIMSIKYFKRLEGDFTSPGKNFDGKNNFHYKVDTMSVEDTKVFYELLNNNKDTCSQCPVGSYGTLCGINDISITIYTKNKKYDILINYLQGGCYYFRYSDLNNSMESIAVPWKYKLNKAQLRVLKKYLAPVFKYVIRTRKCR